MWPAHASEGSQIDLATLIIQFTVLPGYRPMNPRIDTNGGGDWSGCESVVLLGIRTEWRARMYIIWFMIVLWASGPVFVVLESNRLGPPKGLQWDIVQAGSRLSPSTAAKSGKNFSVTAVTAILLISWPFVPRVHYFLVHSPTRSPFPAYTLHFLPF